MIIGITGTLGAGKGTVAKYLVEKHNFTYLSVRNFIAAEIGRRGLMVNRDTMVKVANELRSAHNPNWIVEQILSEAESQAHALRQKNIVIESIRTIGEAQLLKSRGAKLWAVDADVQVRYNRVVKRASETDSISFEKFQADEAQEMHSDDPNKQNLSGVRDMADLVVHNNDTEAELHTQVDLALQKAE